MWSMDREEGRVNRRKKRGRAIKSEETAAMIEGCWLVKERTKKQGKEREDMSERRV